MRKIEEKLNIHISYYKLTWRNSNPSTKIINVDTIWLSKINNYIINKNVSTNMYDLVTERNKKNAERSKLLKRFLCTRKINRIKYISNY